MQRVIVGLGEVLWDIFGRRKHLGGAPANFAYHAGALGDRGVVVSRVGDDALGREILHALARLGMPAEYVQVDRRRATGTVEVELDPAGRPAFRITPNVAWDHLRISRALLRLARAADAVCYGTLAQRSAASRRTIRASLDAAKDALRVCDLNLRADFLALTATDRERAEIVACSIQMADVLKLNDDELKLLGRVFARPEDDDRLMRWLITEFHLRLVCVTLGARGCVLRTPRRRVRARGVRVRVADTVGSGDAFTAAMVHGLLRRWPLDAVAEFANRLGAYVASRPGATPPLDGFRRAD